MKIDKLFLTSLLHLGFFLSCSNERGIQELRIVYAPEYVNINVPATCSSFEFELIDVKRKKVSDKALLRKVDDALMGLKIDTENNLLTKSVDVRVRCFINYENKTDTLCLGEFFGTVFNGELMVDNPTLLNLFKANIYNQ